LRGEKPVYPPKSADLMAALRDFELTYASYAEFQRGMERYWCLRWLAQENATTVCAQVLKENIVRFDAIPLVIKASGMPTLDRGARVRLSVSDIDLLAAEAKIVFIELLGADSADAALEVTEVEEGGE
jgi:exoribonuclease-2